MKKKTPLSTPSRKASSFYSDSEFSSHLSLAKKLPVSMVKKTISLALEEDLSSGDMTTDACISESSVSVASGVAKQEMVVSGLMVVKEVFHLLDESLHCTIHVNDGDKVVKSTKLWTIKGSSRSILMAERVALNFVQRMSGVASFTRRYVDALYPAVPKNGVKTRITDTRKTTPGLRFMERYAVRCGGAYNHRDNLGSAILIKDNHIAACGGVKAAITRAKMAAPHTCKIECEVDTLSDLMIALRSKADIVMLDNMTDEQIAEAVEINQNVTAGDVWLEVSGGITLSRVASLSELGVHAISVGALTHSAPAVDIGLDFE